MRTIAAALALSAIFTIEQRDAYRSSIDDASSDISADGRFIAFSTYSQLVPVDTDRSSDVYVLDRFTKHVTLESVEVESRSDMRQPRLNGDGRFLVYVDDETVTLRDRGQNTSRGLGVGRQPCISEDGTMVVFATAKHLVEVRGGVVRPVSTGMAGTSSALVSVSPSVSADGRFLSFSARLPRELRLKPDTTYRVTSASEIFLRDAQSSTTRRIATGWKPSLSGDGRYLAYVDLVRNVPQIFLADLTAGTVRVVTNNSGGRPANGASANPRISSNGRFIVFQSEASDLVDAEDFNLLHDVFIFDRLSGRMARLSGDEGGGWMEPSQGPSIDGSGAVVAFSSRHPTDASDKKNDFDLYVGTLQSPSASAIPRLTCASIQKRATALSNRRPPFYFLLSTFYFLFFHFPLSTSRKCT